MALLWLLVVLQPSLSQWWSSQRTLDVVYEIRGGGQVTWITSTDANNNALSHARNVTLPWRYSSVQPERQTLRLAAGMIGRPAPTGFACLIHVDGRLVAENHSDGPVVECEYSAVSRPVTTP